MQKLVSRDQATKAKEPALEGAIICSACGCVWVRDNVAKPHVLGTLRWTGVEYKWSSPYKPKPPADTLAE